jgi:hypothetical protein
MQICNDFEEAVFIPLQSNHDPDSTNNGPLRAGNPSLTHLLPKLHGYSPNQHEYQVCQPACRIIYIFNSSSITCYTTVFFINSPALCRTISFMPQGAASELSILIKINLAPGQCIPHPLLFCRGNWIVQRYKRFQVLKLANING